MSICLFGGTFDPPHIGHLVIADSIMSSIDLEQLIFIPASVPPHKAFRSYSPASMRVEMLQIALQGTPAFEISTIELDRRGISYSVDTIKEISQEMNLCKEEIYFLIGSDSLAEFHTWKNPMEILSLANVIVAPRSSYTREMAQSEYLQHVSFLDSPRLDISSSTIRQRVREGKSIRYLVPSGVLKYIQENRLYLPY